MKVRINGDGGEFTIGQLTEKETDFIFKNVDNSTGEMKIDPDDFWESDDLERQWFDISDVLHMNAPYGDGGWRIMITEAVKGNCDDEIANQDSEGLGSFEIDYENDDKFEMSDNNSKVVIGVNHLDIVPKGLLTEKGKDFDEEERKELTEEGKTCLMVRSREKGDFWEFDLPDDFDISKLIVITVKVKFCESFYVPFIDTIIYDGKIIETEFSGDTQIQERICNVIEMNYDEGSDQFSNDNALEFYT